MAFEFIERLSVTLPMYHDHRLVHVSPDGAHIVVNDRLNFYLVQPAISDVAVHIKLPQPLDDRVIMYHLPVFSSDSKTVHFSIWHTELAERYEFATGQWTRRYFAIDPNKVFFLADGRVVFCKHNAEEPGSSIVTVVSKHEISQSRFERQQETYHSSHENTILGMRSWIVRGDRVHTAIKSTIDYDGNFQTEDLCDIPWSNVHPISYAPDNRKVAVSDGFGFNGVTDLDTGESINSSSISMARGYDLQFSRIVTFAFAFNSEHVIIVYSSTIVLVDPATMDVRARIDVTPNISSESLAISRDGTTIAAVLSTRIRDEHGGHAMYSNVLRVWNLGYAQMKSAARRKI